MCVACCIVCAVNHVLYCARLAFGNVCIVGCVVCDLRCCAVSCVLKFVLSCCNVYVLFCCCVM